METKNLIQTTANVIKITNVKKGDILKIAKEEYSSVELYYGVVIDLLNTGSKSYITILQYKKSYGDISAEIKTFKGTEDLSIFPAEINEVKEYFEEAVNKLEKTIEEDKEKLQTKIDAVNKAKEFISGELSKTLSVVDYQEITQKEFNDIERQKIIAQIQIEE